MTLITIGSWFGEVWTTLWLSLSTVVYGFITLLYRIFLSVANVNLFSKDVFDKITGRLYIVMSIAMLFIFAYNLVFMIIDPDGKQKGSMTKVVKDTIISLVLVVLLPTIFNYLYVAQYHILNSNVIDNIIFDNQDKIGTDCDKFKEVTIEYEGDIGWLAKWARMSGPLSFWYWVEKDWEANGGGGTDNNAQNKLYDYCVSYNSLEPSYVKGATAIPGTIFSAFFYPSEFTMDECEEWIFDGQGDSETFKGDTGKMCKNYYYDMTAARYTGTVYPILKDPYLIKEVQKDDSPIEFNYIFAFIAGCLACYMYICYVLKIGVRVAKLGFLQIISPIPVMLRIIPGQGMFKKWLDQIKTTYLDVFIRVAIIDFTLFGISMAPNMIDTLFANTLDGDLWLISSLSLVVIILGLMQFASEAPQLFKDLFGGSGNFALKSPRKQLAENKLAMGAVNRVRGGVYGATTGSGFKDRFSGMIRGAHNGAGGYDKAVKNVDSARTARENGSTFGGRFLDRARSGIGMRTRADQEDVAFNRESEERIRDLDLQQHTIEEKRLAANIAQRQAYNKEASGYRKNIVDSASSVRDKVDSKYVETISYTDSSGQLQTLTGNASRFQDELDYLKQSGASADIIHDVKEKIESAKKSLNKKIIDDVISGNSGDMSKSLFDSMSVSYGELGRMNDNHQLGDSGSNINLSNSSDIISGLENVLHEQTVDIDKQEQGFASQSQDIERQRKDIERQKKDRNVDSGYRSRRADSDSVKRNNSGNNNSSGNH